eukprot:2674660-Rhodomonas_salina.3
MRDSSFWRGNLIECCISSSLSPSGHTITHTNLEVQKAISVRVEARKRTAKLVCAGPDLILRHLHSAFNLIDFSLEKRGAVLSSISCSVLTTGWNGRIARSHNGILPRPGLPVPNTNCTALPLWY